MREFICKNCGNKFRSYNKDAKFCSHRCATIKIWTGRKHTEEWKKKVRKSEIWNRLEEMISLYKLGRTCQEIADLTKVNKNTLKNIFRIIGFKMRPATKRLGVESWLKGKPYYAFRGENNPNWKGGITNLNQQIRHCIEMKNWKRSIREQNDYTCQICEKRGGNNEVHHYPKTFSLILKDNKIKSYQDAQKCDELWSLDNGRTLCLKCHNKTKKSRSNK